MNLIKIENDVFFISQRLREIDPSYQLFYNPSNSAYEVHTSSQAKNSYCFKVPFDAIDERTLFFAKKTRVENRDLIIKEIEQNNQQIYQSALKEQVNLLKEAICQ